MELEPVTAIKLMAHQEEGVSFLISAKSGLLAFEQGLGKTLVAIEAFQRILVTGAVDAMVVICPNSLKRTWGAELKKFAPILAVEIVDGAAKVRRDILSMSRATVFIINYEAARNEILALRALLQRRRAVLVLDESHYVKNCRSLNTTAAQHLAPFAPYRWLLSGTPITNSPADIYPQICLVAGSQPFGSHASFEASFANAAENPSVCQALSERIKPYVLRRTKGECLDLPAKTFVDIMVELPPWQRKIYNAMRDDLSHEVEGMSTEEFRRFIPTALTRLLRLSQVASNPGLIMPDDERVPGKVAELDRIIEELIGINKQKVILWSYYVATIEKLMARYSQYGAAALYGGTPSDERNSIAAQFQEDPELKLLLANPAAAGTGFTLTAASYTIYETLSWRYDYYAQSQDRNHRIGQKNAVTYIRLIAEGTVEQAIAEALARKAQMAGAIVGDDALPVPIAELTRLAFCEMLQTGSLPA
jgi:SNF2 family DNA or RNA helicase